MRKTDVDTSMKSRILLADWLRQPHRTTGKTARELADEATKDLGYKYNFRQITYLCKELDIEWEKPRKAHAHADERQDILALTQRINELEKQLGEINTTVKILKSFYINTSKEPKISKKQLELNLVGH